MRWPEGESASVERQKYNVNRMGEKDKDTETERDRGKVLKWYSDELVKMTYNEEDVDVADVEDVTNFVDDDDDDDDGGDDGDDDGDHDDDVYDGDLFVLFVC